ncbi:MAG: F0F1 ATP synthase subunit A, partial [Acetobacteraceae bacterium]|nr:F0F1 ATP synthase subunit A [Acetobacteraceae bacterium]
MAAEAPPKIDALGQFELHSSLGAIGRSVNFTQSNLMMIIGAALVLGTLYYGAKPKAVVPGRFQALAEIAYTGVMQMAVGSIGPEGKRFFPFIFALFFFVLMGNLLGLLPYSFTYTSHIAVTAGLAVMV